MNTQPNPARDTAAIHPQGAGGQLLREQEKAKGGDHGGRKPKDPRVARASNGAAAPTLKKLGISADQSSRWQKLAENPKLCVRSAMIRRVRFTTIHNIEWWAQQVMRGCETHQEYDGPRFLRPVHFAVVAGHTHRLGLNLKVPARLEAYASRMHLWQAIGLESPRQVTERDPEGRFHPLTPIRTENDADVVADDICRVFRASGTRSRKTLNAIGSVLSEIAGNCFHHAGHGTDIRGLVCAQTWPKGKLAQVVVADAGVGIRASLARNPAHSDRLAATNAVKLATEYGVTGNPDGHSGYGLTLARDLMRMHGGNFVCISGQEAFRAMELRTQTRSLPRGWQGTIVVLEWRTDHPLNVLPVYRSWPDSEAELP